MTRSRPRKAKPGRRPAIVDRAGLRHRGGTAEPGDGSRSGSSRSFFLFAQEGRHQLHIPGKDFPTSRRAACVLHRRVRPLLRHRQQDPHHGVPSPEITIPAPAVPRHARGRHRSRRSVAEQGWSQDDTLAPVSSLRRGRTAAHGHQRVIAARRSLTGVPVQARDLDRRLACAQGQRRGQTDRDRMLVRRRSSSSRSSTRT